MKRLKMVIAAAAMLVLLGACGQKKDASEESSETKVSTEQSTNQSTENSTDSADKVSEVSVFTGTLTEDATVMDNDNGIRISLNGIEVVSDPEAILPMMENDGVILNAQESQLSEGVTVDTLKAGDKIRFTLTGLPIMTMSIPPQIPGNSISLIEKIEE
ncbi:hypothetical protein [Enterococcus sp. BWR-S5]|uniref:hypothetical protein n=1 Tax=Enterococcus sp. BWR-S5 TaxID=2787714 RepID=UPI001923EDF7|nr:hypothetical protein [Enterococcus sp. BWR-S5]MBL1224995.1 hypothetical protein [Enterococcus sp. BWR-S5]